jgi:hypothetical protein
MVVGLQVVAVVVHGMVHKMELDLDHRVRVAKVVVVMAVKMVLSVHPVLNTRVVEVVVGRSTKVLLLRTVVMVVRVLFL